MSLIDVPIYRNERRTISWGPEPEQSARPGWVIIDPPEYIVERNGDQLARIDEAGHVAKYDLENMRLEDARRIADHANTDAVDERSSREEIVNVLSPDVQTATEHVEDDDRDESAWEKIENDSGKTAEELAAESLDPGDDGDDAE